MAGAFVGGAILGAGFGELLAAVRQTGQTIVMFKSLFEDLDSTLTDMEDISRRTNLYKELLDRENEMDKMNQLTIKGKALIDKCSKAGKLNLWKRYRYSKQLQKFDGEIKRFFWFNMPLVIHGGILETLVGVKDLSAAFNRLRLNLEGPGVVEKNSLFGNCAVPEAPDFVVGMDSSLEHLKTQLLQEGLSVIVVSAPGGCGKTTLVTKLCHDANIKGKFKNIFFLRVSQSYNLIAMVQDMIHLKHADVPEIKTDDDAIYHLQDLLDEIGDYPVLLVLDDVWSNSESLIRKFMCKIPDYKILVTSRFEFPNFGPPHRLNHLNDHDARKLFLHSAVSQDKFSLVKEVGLEKLVNNEELLEKVLGVPATTFSQIVKHCGGFPLVLTVVARSVCGQDRSIWESKLLEWSGGSLIGSENEVLDCLQRSLHDLEDTRMFECFLDLGSFPEDHKIPAVVLIDIWIELYKFDPDGVQAVGFLHTLCYRNLLNVLITRKQSTEGDAFYGDLYFMQHDLLRELAIHQNNKEQIEQRKRLHLDIRENKIPDWVVERHERPLSARFLCITSDEKFKSDWPEIELPAVEVLVLNFRTENYTLPSFIGRMRNLKALVVSNNGSVPVELNNFALLGSLPNLKRIRLERIKIPFLSMSTARLNSLEKASFFMCNISRELMKSDFQLHEALPNLSEIDISYCPDLENLPVGICSLKTLKKINITNCHNLSALAEEIHDLVNLEVLRLNSCTSLQGIPGSIGALTKLSFLDISDCFGIGRLPNQIGELEKLKELHMKGCLRLSVLPRSVKKLEQLKYVYCDEEGKRLWRSFKPHLPKLSIRVVEEDGGLDWLRVR